MLFFFLFFRKQNLSFSFLFFFIRRCRSLRDVLEARLRPFVGEASERKGVEKGGRRGAFSLLLDFFQSILCVDCFSIFSLFSPLRLKEELHLFRSPSFGLPKKRQGPLHSPRHRQTSPLMSERRLAVLARHLAAPNGGEHNAPSMVSPSPVSATFSSSQLGSFCPRELSSYMTHDNHELRENIREFLKVRKIEFIRREKIDSIERAPGGFDAISSSRPSSSHSTRFALFLCSRGRARGSSDIICAENRTEEGA